MSLAADTVSTPAPALGIQPPAAPRQAHQEAKLKEACRQFESLFLGMLWKEMRKTVDKSGFLTSSFGEEMFSDMLDQAMADAASKGGSMGIADLLYQQLKPQPPVRPGANVKEYLRPLKPSPLSPPVEGARLTSGFGLREHPLLGGLREHQGVDLAAPLGTPVKAARPGVVSFAGDKGGYGNLVILEHADGSQSYYAHLDQVLVEQGQRLASGQQLGTVGSSGLATGPHLHFEIRDPQGNPTDPWPLLAQGTAVTT